MTRSCVVLLVLAIAGCGPSKEEPSGNGGAAGTMPMSGGSGGAAGTAGSSGAGGMAGASGAMAEADLFTDPSVPDCTMGGSSWRLAGTIGDEQVMLTDALGISSNIEPGKLYVLGVEPGGGITVGDTYHPLILSWEGSVMERGTSRPLTGTRFLMPGGDPAMPSGYCIVSGDIGPTTDMPTFYSSSASTRCSATRAARAQAKRFPRRSPAACSATTSTCHNRITEHRPLSGPLFTA